MNKKNKKSKKARSISGPHETGTALLKDAVVQALSTPTESICEKARRLAQEDKMKKLKERELREVEFLRKMFEVNDLRAAGVIANKIRPDGAVEWVICGHGWVYEETLRGLNPDGKADYCGYLRYVGSGDYIICFVYDLVSFGNALESLEKRPTPPPSEPVFTPESTFGNTSGKSLWQRIREAIFGN